MKPLYYLILLLSALRSVPVTAQDANQNYIQTRVMLNEAGSRFLETIQYYDRLGRPSVNVQKGITPSGGNLVGLREYDSYSRESVSWLPVVSTADYLSAADFKAAATDYYGNGERPYSSNGYEASPLNRILKVHGPGVGWNDHPVATGYLVNTASGDLSCKNYTVSGSGTLTDNGYYAAGQLYAQKTADEDGRISYLFTDKLGKQILSRQISGNQPHDTYFVYDDFGNRCFVLPPAYQSESDLPLYAYQYKYDGWNRCKEKKLPGCDPIYYVYDKADKVVFSQDGVQRGRLEWTFYLYDSFGRLTVQGICKNQDPSSACETIVTCSLAKIDNGISTTGLANSGYNSSYSLSSPVVHLVNYYDNYDFLSLSGFSGTSGFTSPLADATGSLTGNMASMLDNPTSRLCSAIYYDTKGRPVKEVAGNHLGGYKETVTTYTFTGKPLTVVHKHEAPGKAALTETYTYTYNDYAEQLVSVTHQLNNNPAVLLSANTYDDLGRAHTCTHHGNEMLKSTYSYNIRSWISRISGTYFSQNLSYESGGQHNGNISSMTWKSGQETAIRGYSFNYDGLNRLLGASYLENGSSSDHYNTSYSYDKMGNMKTLIRNGLLSRPDNFGPIDHIVKATYIGNQLYNAIRYISDGPLYFGAFSNSVGKEMSFYSYDVNGNLIKDTGKEISNIEYNHLNLPQFIQFTDRKEMNYSYSADGIKRRYHYVASKVPDIFPIASVMTLGDRSNIANRPLRDSMHTVIPRDTLKEVIPAGDAPFWDGPTYFDRNIQLDYCDNVIYENGSLSKILTDAGYITLADGLPVYHYNLLDHQGNVRVVMNQNSTVEEVNHYYPFGGLFGEGIDTDKQPYKFGGKELNRMHGLDWYDSGARYLRSDAPGWTSMDPLCEMYYSWSPYAYCMNNPVNMIDPDGRQGVAVVKGARYVAKPHSLKKMYQAIKTFIFGAAVGTEGTEIYNYYVDGDRSEEVFNALTKGVNLEGADVSNSQSEVESASAQASHNPDDGGDNKEKKANPKREAREKAKAERDNQPASEKYAKDKARAKGKAEGPDARRKAHDAKDKGAPDRSKKQIDEDYNIKL